MVGGIRMRAPASLFINRGEEQSKKVGERVKTEKKFPPSTGFFFLVSAVKKIQWREKKKSKTVVSVKKSGAA